MYEYTKIKYIYAQTYVLCEVGMNSASFDILNGMLMEFREEYEKLQKLIDDNDSKMKEADCYKQSLFSKEDMDFKMFSPRSEEDLFREKIEKADSEKLALQQQNNVYYHEQNVLRSKIGKLDKVLKDEQGYHSQIEQNSHNFYILNIQEEDRKRIARDLHDTSLQNLAHLVHKIELCSLFITQDPLRAKLELSVVSKNLKSIIEEVRNTIFDLRPMTFDDLGFASALERLITVVNENKAYQMDVDIQNVSCENNLVLTTIYRVVKESLENIVKHAESSKILFHTKQLDNTYLIEIEDNGKGFLEEEINDEQKRHFGISVMKERICLLGGKIEIHSEKERGTKIHIEVPLLESVI